MADGNTAVFDKRDRLLALLKSYESCAVAFSAGVDSTVVAKAAALALGKNAVAVTAESPSVPPREVEQARELAKLIGIRHEVVRTDEFSDTQYTRNASDRCYHCKSELYSKLHILAPRLGVKVMVNGVNCDDLGDYRPGIRAATENQIKSPLAECGFHKEDIRALAAYWELPVSDKPASPCLSSRVAYGEEVTPERVQRIDAAEIFLHELGLPELRVRLHRGDLARIEVPPAEVARLAEPAIRERISRRFRELGFQYVTLDLEGFRTGSMNEVLPVESLSMIR